MFNYEYYFMQKLSNNPPAFHRHFENLNRYFKNSHSFLLRGDESSGEGNYCDMFKRNFWK